MSKIFGLAFHSPLIIHSLVPPRDYGRALLVTDSPTEIKKEVDTAVKSSRKRPIVMLAGSLSILQSFLKEYVAGKHSDVQWKIVLFDFPGLLVPFDLPSVKWLDCDNQSGGAWQITKLKPDSFAELLGTLKPLDKKTAEDLLKVTRHIPTEKIQEIESILKSLPQTYRDLIPAEETKRSQKKVKKQTTPKAKL